MATARADKKYQSWDINDKFKVSVVRDNPAYSDAKVEFQCFNTKRSNVDLKADCRPRKTIVQFPVQGNNAPDATNNLKRNFKEVLKKFVKKENNYVMIPIDDVKGWTIKKFCETVLEEFIAFAEERKSISYTVKLEFCTMMDYNFGEAVKACEAAKKGVKSEPDRQKVSRTFGPSVKIVKDSLENIKVDAIACTTSHDFNLSLGAVSNALLKKAGASLQKELNSKSGGKSIGEVVATGGHRLDCIVVFFCGMNKYTPTYASGYKSPEQYYRSSVHDFMQRCLNLAEKRRIHSIAFPAIGAGSLSYPVNIVADEMFRTVDNWRGTYVKEVKFVIFPKDEKVLKEFERVQKKYGQTQTSTFYRDNPEAKQALRKNECKFQLPKGYTTEFITMCCIDAIEHLKKSDCEVSFRKDAIIVKFPHEIVAIGKDLISDALKRMQQNYPIHEYIDLTESNFKLSDVKKEVDEIEKNNTHIKCSINSNETQVSLYGKSSKAVKEAKDKVVKLLLPQRGATEHSNQKDLKGSKVEHTNQNSSGLSSQFSWSTKTKELRVFLTKEKVTVKVYSSDILNVPVDCIVNAANTGLKHGGGIAKAIADAAGRDLTQEGRDYLKKHGKLRVGEACSTTAGKMHYKYVIHAVGPCWSDYKPYSLRDIEKCGTDLYNAVINSLTEAEKLNMETIAVSSISSGIYGCPLDLCSVQYAQAVMDYTALSRSPLKEIHFVDTNIEMVKVLHETFESMIHRGYIPRSYNKLQYVKTEVSHSLGKGRTSSARGQEKVSDMDNFDSHRSKRVKPGLVSYPFWYYDYPPGHSMKELACCFGPGQNLYIYCTDILTMTSKDMIACGNTPNGKTKGYLANAIKVRAGEPYKAEMNKAFAKKAKEGEVIICSAGNLKNFKWVNHAILHKRSNCSYDYKWKVKSPLRNIFVAMKSKGCTSIALPLVGTDKGNADPDFCGQRFFEALEEFAGCNKSYIFKVHLVHTGHKETENAKAIIKEACSNARPQQRRRNQPVTQDNRQYNGARPKSSPLTHSDHYGKSNEQNRRHSGYLSPSENTRQTESSIQAEDMRKQRERNEEDVGLSTTNSYDGGKSVHLRNTTLDEGTMRKGDTLATHRENRNTIRNTERYSRNENATYEQSLRSDASPDRSSGSDGNENEIPAKKNQGNLRIFDETSEKKEHTKEEVKQEDKISEDAKQNKADHPDDEDDDSEEEEEVYDEEPWEEEVLDDGPNTTEQDEAEEIETCVICMDEITDPRTLSCGHKFCTECIEAQFTYKEVCPTCGNVCGIITGDQPYGRMDVVKNDRASCAGFEGCGRIEITYKFPDGTQGPSHPRPGARYKGITRTAYLPNNRRGNEVCEMLKIAFERKLVFTIGNSRTTGAEGVITWNDIHHKTDQKPNTQFGYPDPSYLDRVTDELKIKGVTVNDIPTVSVSHRHNRR